MSLPLLEGVVLRARPVDWDDDQGYVVAGPWVDGVNLEGEWRHISDGRATLGNGHHYEVEVAKNCSVCDDLLYPDAATPDGVCEKFRCQRSRG